MLTANLEKQFEATQPNFSKIGPVTSSQTPPITSTQIALVTLAHSSLVPTTIDVPATSISTTRVMKPFEFIKQFDNDLKLFW